MTRNKFINFSSLKFALIFFLQSIEMLYFEYYPASLQNYKTFEL